MYVKIHKAIYGHCQAGILVIKLLEQLLALHGHYKVQQTPGLWQHISRPIAFTLVVGDFSIKYVNKQDADNLISCLQGHCMLTIDWIGEVYCDIKPCWK